MLQRTAVCRTPKKYLETCVSDVLVKSFPGSGVLSLYMSTVLRHLPWHCAHSAGGGSIVSAERREEAAMM